MRKLPPNPVSSDRIRDPDHLSSGVYRSLLQCCLGSLGVLGGDVVLDRGPNGFDYFRVCCDEPRRWRGGSR